MDLPANEAEWQRVLHLSSSHLVAPMLRRAYQEHGLVSGLPADVVEFLDAVYTLNLESNLRYQYQLAQLIQALNDTGVRPLLLKGAATLASGLYPTPGERMIGDIDVLIPSAKLAGAVEHLLAAGYQPV
ncbi:MAG: nucleotidyltransferase family protein, partial [Methylocella sp.]